MLIQYSIKLSWIQRYLAFYNYLHELEYKDDSFYTREDLINSLYPFGICIKKKKIIIIESATNCFLMQKSGKMKNVEEFKEIISNKKR